MAPTLHDGDLVLASRAALARAAPARGDIVLMRDPESGVAYVKRIVGLPGEDVGVQLGRVAIHGSPLDEPYLSPLDSRAAARDGQWALGEDQYFLLGDNRNDSLDSRAFGPVAGGWIVGRVWYRYGPAGRVGPVTSSLKGRE
jgi:signal peptidase I